MQRVSEGNMVIDTTTTVTRNGFLRGLEAVLIGQPELMAAAHSLVMSDDARAFIGDLSDPRIVMAVELYTASSFEVETTPPSLAQVSAW